MGRLSIIIYLFFAYGSAYSGGIAKGALLKTDANAQYAAVIEIDLAEVTDPILACPIDSEGVKKLPIP